MYYSKMLVHPNEGKGMDKRKTIPVIVFIIGFVSVFIVAFNPDLYTKPYDDPEYIGHIVNNEWSSRSTVMGETTTHYYLELEDPETQNRVIVSIPSHMVRQYQKGTTYGGVYNDYQSY